MQELNEKYGVWVSNNFKFDDSYDAYRYASDNSAQVNFFYHHDIYNNFDISNLGNTSLDYLYKQRALKLRDTYDYLILYYSGGADSHNILRTFLDNNIKLDEICIKWPKALRDGKFYIANNIDTSARNYWSEWDYAVKPILDWLVKKHPDIKITFKDFVGDPNNMDIDKMFEDTKHHQFQTGIILNSLVSNSEVGLIDKGKTVGNIYGVNKPVLATHSNKLFMFFTDNALRVCVKSTINPYGAECFYWDPNMPEIAFEQAYQTAMHYKANKNDRKFLVIPTKFRTPETLSTSVQTAMQDEISKKYIYTTWDNRFQSKKPASQARLDKFYWFYESVELTRPKEIFYDNVSERLKLINTSFLTDETTNTQVISTLKTLRTPNYYITTLQDSHD